MISLSDGRSELYQWDTKRTLNVDFDCSQVHFSNRLFGRSIDVDVVDGFATIPDVLLQSDNDLMVWAFAGTPENGYTKIAKVFKVNKRNKPADYVFTPPEQTTLGELVGRIEDLEEMQDPEAIKNAVDDYLANNPIHVKETDPTVPDWAKQPTKPSYTAAEVGALSQGQLQSGINTALAQAKASGEFDGADGQSGKDGVDGYSPAAKVTQTANGATVTITDKTGTTTATITNGKDGKNGADGYTPQKGVDYFDGQPGADGKDGADGKPGSDGKDGSPGKDGVSATHSWNGTKLTVTSASGTSSADLKGDKGDKGDTGAKGDPGDDYVLTTADKEEIAELAAGIVDTALLALIGTGEVTG